MASTPRAGSGDARPARSRYKGTFVTSYGEGRLCAAAGCSTRLSRYNQSELCWPHADELERRNDRDR